MDLCIKCKEITSTYGIGNETYNKCPKCGSVSYPTNPKKTQN